MTVELLLHDLLSHFLSPRKAAPDKLQESVRTLATECSDVFDETSRSSFGWVSECENLVSSPTPSLSPRRHTTKLQREKFPSLRPLSMLVTCDEEKEGTLTENNPSQDDSKSEVLYSLPSLQRKVYRTPTPDAGMLEGMANHPVRRHRRVRKKAEKEANGLVKDGDDDQFDQEVIYFVPAPRRAVYRTPTPDVDLLEGMVRNQVRRNRRVTRAQQQAALILQRAWRKHQETLN
jgi:hypothetical protein